MQPISDYAAENDKLRLLLQGPSGVGKTTLAAQFPGAYFIDLDRNLGGTLRWIKEQNLKGAGLTLPVGFDVVDFDPKEKKPVPEKQRFLRLDKCLLEGQTIPEVETIVIDSGTILSDILIWEVCRQQNKNAITDWNDGRQFWGLFAPLCRHFFSVLAQMRKHIVLIVHEKTQTNAAGAVIYPIKVAWPGQVGQNIGAFFTNVWRAEVQKTPDGVDKMKYSWLIRTMPDQMYELKNTLGLPAKFEFKWETIQAALDKGKELK